VLRFCLMKKREENKNVQNVFIKFLKMKKRPGYRSLVLSQKLGTSTSVSTWMGDHQGRLAAVNLSPAFQKEQI